MGKNKLIIWIYLSISFNMNGQNKSSETILNQLSREGEIIGFVENYHEKNIWVNFPIIPPLLSETKLKKSSKYGYRTHPIHHALKFHSGLDLITLETDTVVATANGIVQQVGYQNGLGLFIVIRHEYGFMTLYGHLNAVFVQVNQVVDMAQSIGLMGNTGIVTGKHLHYSIIKNGFYLNPLLIMYLFQKVPEIH
ncbi:MAG: M23 family metallopeptidase [Arcicella sp.]|jgi:murein DD-endopeptidase MepM/ murein hydrolase activator NlpD|nr:M23 family metallopeptidase [Arcicella sp.]